jgi:hypothetical protein
MDDLIQSIPAEEDGKVRKKHFFLKLEALPG